MTNETPNFQASADTRFLAQRLRKSAVGDLITYEELSAEIGKKVDGSLSSLYSARRMLEKHDRIVFDVVVKVGLKRLNDIEIVGTSTRTTQRIRRAAKRGVRTLTAVNDFSALPRDKQMSHTAAVSVLGVVAEMTSERSIARVEKAAEGKRGELPIADTLAAFRK